MFKKIYLRKILISISSLFALFLIYIFPDEVNKLSDVKEEVVYTNNQLEFNDIYLIDDYNMVSLTSIYVSSDELIDKAYELVEVLINGGVNEDRIPNGFRSIIPSETKILDITYNDNIININFSSQLLDVSESDEEKMIEAIIYTLTSIDSVEGIIISVEGNILRQLPKTKINLPEILNRSFGINKQYDITSSKNIVGVTTYFVNKNNDTFYYVPVTKYLNDDRDKIKIVVDLLSSSSNYNTNLMSFLNSNTELIGYVYEDDVMKLNFNEYIYNDFDSKEILEEVIYTICLSVNDNYDVDEVIFNVNDEEIYKSVLKSIEN